MSGRDDGCRAVGAGLGAVCGIVLNLGPGSPFRGGGFRRLKPMRDFAWSLRRHEEDVLNYFKLGIDNGAVEGMNNKAKVVSRRCYGFRTVKPYIMVLYHCLGKLPEPVLVHRFL